MEFSFSRLLFAFRLESDCADRDLLLRLKAVLPELFRAESGCSGPGCPGCRAGGCPWHETFARELSSDPSAVKRFQKPSLPFALELPTIPPVPNGGAELHVGLVLAGRAVNHLSLYLAALQRAFLPRPAGVGIAASLVGVASLDAAGVPTVLMESGRLVPGGLVVLTPSDLLAGRAQAADRLEISFRTPLRIVRDGRPLREIAFGDLARGLLRRMSSLSHYYADAELPFDYRWLADRSAQVSTLSADLRWTDLGGGWCGVTGRAVYAGDLSEFLPLLYLGELFHLGKGAGWGQGSYRLSL